MHPGPCRSSTGRSATLNGVFWLIREVGVAVRFHSQIFMDPCNYLPFGITSQDPHSYYSHASACLICSNETHLFALSFSFDPTALNNTGLRQ